MCSAASMVISVMPNGNITSTVKKGYGSLQTTTLIKTLEVFMIKQIIFTFFIPNLEFIFYNFIDRNKGRNSTERGDDEST